MTEQMIEQTPSLAWTYHLGTSLDATAGAAPSRCAVEPLDLALPAPAELDTTLGDSIARRASCRHFSAAPMPVADLATVLDAAYGDRGTACVSGVEFTVRPVPSAGARFPLGLHVICRSVDPVPLGTYDYLPSQHALRRSGPAPAPDVLAAVFLGQGYLVTAAAIVVVSAGLRAPLTRYGDRGYRYVLLEAGHVGQNIALACAARGLGSLALGGFLDGSLSRILRLTDGVPICAVALGRPRWADPARARQPG